MQPDNSTESIEPSFRFFLVPALFLLGMISLVALLSLI